MKIEGIKGCYEKTGGLFYFARMCSKIRLHAGGKLPKEYHDLLGNGFDGRTCRYLSVRYEDVKKLVLAGKSDGDVLEWCQANGRRLTDEQVLIYNSFMSKRGWRDDETDGFIPEMIREYGFKDDGSVITDFDLIEMDEGRWYPDMWRDGNEESDRTVTRSRRAAAARRLQRSRSRHVDGNLRRGRTAIRASLKAPRQRRRPDSRTQRVAISGAQSPRSAPPTTGDG
jgi:hypothetical protein